MEKCKPIKNYTLISGNRYKTVCCRCLTEAIVKAVEMETELQPAHGVWIVSYGGETLAWICNGKDIWEG